MKTLAWVFLLSILWLGALIGQTSLESLPARLQQIFNEAAQIKHYHLKYELSGSRGEDWKQWKELSQAYRMSFDPDGPKIPEAAEPSYDDLIVQIDDTAKLTRYETKFIGASEATLVRQYHAGNLYLQYVPSSQQARLGHSGFARVYADPVKLLGCLPTKPKVAALPYSWDAEKMVPINQLMSSALLKVLRIDNSQANSTMIDYQYDGGKPIRGTFLYDQHQLREITYRNAWPTPNVPADLDQPLSTRITIAVLKPGQKFPQSIVLERFQSLTPTFDVIKRIQAHFPTPIKREYCLEKRVFQIQEFQLLEPEAPLQDDSLPFGTTLENSLTHKKRVLLTDESIVTVMQATP